MPRQLRNSLPPKVGVVIGVGLLALAALIYWLQTHRPPVDRRQFFYDINAGELIAVPEGTLAPIDLDSGPNAGVQAMVFACGDCADKGQREILYLIKYRTDDGALVEEDPLLRRVDEDAWHHRFSESGEALFGAFVKRQRQCREAGKRFNACRPMHDE